MRLMMGTLADAPLARFEAEQDPSGAGLLPHLFEGRILLGKGLRGAIPLVLVGDPGGRALKEALADLDSDARVTGDIAVPVAAVRVLLFAEIERRDVNTPPCVAPQIVTEWGMPYQVRVSTRISVSASLKAQSRTGPASTFPESHRPGRMSEGWQPLVSATSRMRARDSDPIARFRARMRPSFNDATNPSVPLVAWRNTSTSLTGTSQS